MPNNTDRRRDEALKDTFPASDPPATSGITGGKSPTDTPKEPSHDRAIHERPTGTPTSDRHATETAHQWEHNEQNRQSGKD